MPPPSALVPVPTLMKTLLPRPSVAAPDPISTAPVFPSPAEPELYASRPLIPPTPPFVVDTKMLPLLLVAPNLLEIDRSPPLCN